jgi:hypothetical protein
MHPIRNPRRRVFSNITIALDRFMSNTITTIISPCDRSKPTANRYPHRQPALLLLQSTQLIKSRPAIHCRRRHPL